MVVGVGSRHALAEDVVRPDLIAEYDRDEAAGSDRHDRQRVGRRGRIVDRQAVLGRKARHHEAREEPEEEGDDRQGDGEAAADEALRRGLVDHIRIGSEEDDGGEDESARSEGIRVEVGIDVGESHAQDEEDDGESAGLFRHVLHAHDEVAVGEAHRQKCRAVEGEDEDEGEAADDGVGREQAEEAARVRHVRVDGKACDEVGHGDAPEEGGNDAAEDDALVPAAAPDGGVLVAAQFEGDAAQDERDEHQEEREVERAEHRRVKVREGREARAARRDHPDFVAVPYGQDRAQRDAALLVGLADEGQQHADAVVEAFKEEEAREEHDDQDKP